MSTHCYIAKQIGSNSYRTIFCKLDGYLEVNGSILAQYYTEDEKVDQLSLFAPLLWCKGNMLIDFINFFLGCPPCCTVLTVTYSLALDIVEGIDMLIKSFRCLKI